MRAAVARLVTTAPTRTVPPQQAHFRTSTAKVRWSSSAHGGRQVAA
jgi:hypothetical protein